jgi:hypothetical protein
MASTSESHLPTLEDLDRLSADARIAYTSRIALRAMPLIGESGQIDIWGSKARSNMDALFAANLIAIFHKHPIVGVHAESRLITVRTARHKIRQLELQATKQGKYVLSTAYCSNPYVFDKSAIRAFDATDYTRAYLESKPAPFKDAFARATLLDYHFLHARTLKIEDSRDINALYFEPLFINQKINYE